MWTHKLKLATLLGGLAVLAGVLPGDSLSSSAQWLIGVFQSYPETFALPLALLFAVAASQGLQLVWLPKSWSSRTHLQIMAVVDFVLTYTFSAILWRLLDHDNDVALLRETVCAGLALLAPPLHILGLRAFLHSWPWLDAS
jgi:hypothetical protein